MLQLTVKKLICLLWKRSSSEALDRGSVGMGAEDFSCSQPHCPRATFGAKVPLLWPLALVASDFFIFFSVLVSILLL